MKHRAFYLTALAAALLGSPLTVNGQPPRGTPATPPAAGAPLASPSPKASPAPAVNTLPRLTLDEAIRAGQQYNPSILRLQELRGVARAGEEEAASAGRPFVSIEGLLKDGPKSAPAPRLLGLAQSSDVDLGGGDVVISQQILDFGRTLHSVRYRRFLTQSANYDVAAERDYVTLLVYRAYNNVLAAQHLRDVSKEQVNNRTFVVKQAEAKFDAGLISRVDVDLARASLAESRVNLIQAENDIRQRFVELNNAMGIDRDQQYALEDIPMPAPTAQPPLEDEVRDALAHRPEMLGLQAQILAYEENARAQAAEGKPLFRAVATAGAFTTGPTNSNDYQNWAAGLIMTWPIYTGGLIQSRVAEAKHQADALRAQREQVSQNIRQEVTQARLTLTALEQTRPAIEEQLTRSKDALSLASRRYEAGLSSFLEVQQAELGLLAAETNETRLRYDIATAQAALQYAHGVIAPPRGTQPMPGRGGNEPSLLHLRQSPHLPAGLTPVNRLNPPGTSTSLPASMQEREPLPQPPSRSTIQQPGHGPAPPLGPAPGSQDNPPQAPLPANTPTPPSPPRS
jgi:HAE1 family hydrophobic/amphiphilic exporter-1